MGGPCSMRHKDMDPIEYGPHPGQNTMGNMEPGSIFHGVHILLTPAVMHITVFLITSTFEILIQQYYANMF